MITETTLPPGLVLIFFGLLLPFLNGMARNLLLVLGPLIVLFLVWSLPDGNALQVTYLGYELTLIRADELSRLFGTVFSIVTLAGGLFAVSQSRTSELAAAFIYGGAALGVVFAGDLITVFIFWELMAIASTLVVWSGGAGAKAAGLRYAVVHFLGGVLLMAGIAGEVSSTGSLAFDAMEANSWARWLILAGFLVNAGAPPFTAWLPDAYPAASWSGAVFLSAFTTKTAAYVLMRTFPGTEILIYFGLFMVFYGIVYAILENDMRRILVYSIVNQVGFMVVGVGIGSEASINGAAAHAFVHILYKALLLMAAGAVLYQTGKTKGTELGGLFRTMPKTMICAVIGSLAISAFPYTSGFVAKSLISQGAGDAKIGFVWFSLTAASAGAFLYVGLKFPWFTFFNKDSGLRPSEPPATMLWAMYGLSAACLAIGIFPDLLYDLLPHPVDYEPYTGAHIIFQLQLLLFAGLAFFLFLPLLQRTLTITLDFDWFYRGFGRGVRMVFDAFTTLFWQTLVKLSASVTKTAVRFILKLHGPDGIFSETWSTGTMAFWTTILLGLYLLVFFA